ATAETGVTNIGNPEFLFNNTNIGIFNGIVIGTSVTVLIGLSILDFIMLNTVSMFVYSNTLANEY
ncbi:32903_t:CDS:1, partial [Gigaspora margarita]